MIWAPALVLMTVASPVTSARPLASTFDDAACPPLTEAAEPVDVVVDGPTSCSEPAPVVVVAPAIVDCNDPGMSPWIEEMIGSCDMPKPPPPIAGGPTVVRSPHGSSGTTRVCDGLHCSHDTTPLRSAPRADDDSAQLLASSIALPFRAEVTALATHLRTLRDQASHAPPERPPRG